MKGEASASPFLFHVKQSRQGREGRRWPGALQSRLSVFHVKQWAL